MRFLKPVLLVMLTLFISLTGVFGSVDVLANENLEKLYVFSKKYNRMSPQEKVIFLSEAEKVSDAFSKIPSMVWEDEYSKYRDVMDIYRDIKIDRWKEASRK